MKEKYFKLKTAAVILSLLFLLSLYPLNSAFAENMEEPETVLIINSYHEGLAWTKDETDGIVDALKKSNENLSILIEYMDWKNYPTDESLRYLTEYYQYKYSGKRIDMLIATDDAALGFALDNRESLFSNAPIVFCGINQGGMESIVNGHHNLTGILEEVDPAATVKMAQEINPSLKNVYVLFDNSESGISTGKLVMDKIRSADMGLKPIPLNSLSYDELINDVRSYDKDSIILITTYYSDVYGRTVEFEKVSRDISENSSVPVYHLYDFGLNNGAIGGVMLSGRLQGTSAANLALRILNGEAPDNIPVFSPDATRKVFDYQQLERFGIALDKIPADSEIINKPFSFFETYKTLVLIVLAAFILLTAFICILSFNFLRIRRMKKKLSESHEELTQIYEELAASDEELRQQFEEITAVQESLSRSEERFRIAADGSDAVIWDCEMPAMHYHFSDRWYELLGYEKDELEEARGGWRSIIHPDDAPEADKARNAHLEGKTPFYNCEYRMRRKNGEYLWFNVRGKLLQDFSGNNIRFAGSLVDITDRKMYEERLIESYQELEATYEELTAAQEELKQRYDEILASNETIKAKEERLMYLAYHDTLTGLLNKLSLYESANRDILLPQVGKASLFFIDIDNFKYINDTMGHAFGDQLIISASERLASLVEESCSVYRLSGDEFVITAPDIKIKGEAEAYASRVLAGFKKEFVVLNSAIHISISIGIALYPSHGHNMDELLKNADIAMYRAKESGRSRYVVYNQLMNEAFIERVNIERHLHEALERSEFELYYQPQLDLESNRISGLEALLRWRSPELGSVSTLKFIKAAEDTHLIIPLGAWVLRHACAFLKKLHKKGYTDLSVSVNISILQLLQSDFVDMVMNTLELIEIEPEYLELEITESILIESFEVIRFKLHRIRELGVKIALDDFGKGYSSLSYLRQLPMSTLKIDKSFVDGISTDDKNNMLTGYMVTIGKSMGLCVVAEGVEKQEQLEYLSRHGCHKIQGFLFSRPLPEKEVMKLLESNHLQP